MLSGFERHGKPQDCKRGERLGRRSTTQLRTLNQDGHGGQSRDHACERILLRFFQALVGLCVLEASSEFLGMTGRWYQVEGIHRSDQNFHEFRSTKRWWLAFFDDAGEGRGHTGSHERRAFLVRQTLHEFEPEARGLGRVGHENINHNSKQPLATGANELAGSCLP
jgi:hypothetical protein